jgi:hypothetical protein
MVPVSAAIVGHVRLLEARPGEAGREVQRVLRPEPCQGLGVLGDDPVAQVADRHPQHPVADVDPERVPRALAERDRDARAAATRLVACAVARADLDDDARRRQVADDAGHRRARQMGLARDLGPADGPVLT